MRVERGISEILGKELAITPSDLYHAEFPRVLFRGYARGDVDDFIEQVAEAFEVLSKENQALKQQQGGLKEELDAYDQIERTLRNALASSQKFGENIVESAKREAAALVAEGALEKHRAAINAAELCDALREEIASLKEARNRLRSGLEAMIDTHAAMLETIPAAEDLLVDRAARLPFEVGETGGLESNEEEQEK